MEYTKKFAYLALAGFLITVLANIVSNETTLKSLGLCPNNDLWCSVIVTTLLICTLMIGVGAVVDFSIFTSDHIRWRKYITSIDVMREKPYISANVVNKDKKALKFFCVLKSIEYNGDISDGITKQVTEHSPRMSWSGGSDEEVGIKIIDGEQDGTLNFVSLTNKRLTFETAKGPVLSDFDRGVYKLNLQINRQISDSKFRKKNFHIVFEYYLDDVGDSHIRLIKNL